MCYEVTLYTDILRNMINAGEYIMEILLIGSSWDLSLIRLLLFLDVFLRVSKSFSHIALACNKHLSFLIVTENI